MLRSHCGEGGSPFSVKIFLFRSSSQDFLLRLEELIRTLLLLARPDSTHPLVQAVARDPRAVSGFLNGMALLGHLADGFILELGVYRCWLMGLLRPPKF
jgi:hypothetical protein